VACYSSGAASDTVIEAFHKIHIDQSFQRINYLARRERQIAPDPNSSVEVTSNPSRLCVCFSVCVVRGARATIGHFRLIALRKDWRRSDSRLRHWLTERRQSRGPMRPFLACQPPKQQDDQHKSNSDGEPNKGPVEVHRHAITSRKQSISKRAFRIDGP
jgi:hypothetical protein